MSATAVATYLELHPSLAPQVTRLAEQLRRSAESAREDTGVAGVLDTAHFTDIAARSVVGLHRAFAL